MVGELVWTTPYDELGDAADFGLQKGGTTMKCIQSNVIMMEWVFLLLGLLGHGCMFATITAFFCVQTPAGVRKLQRNEENLL